jgi:hypothetical protein
MGVLYIQFIVLLFKLEGKLLKKKRDHPLKDLSGKKTKGVWPTLLTDNWILSRV